MPSDFGPSFSLFDRPHDRVPLKEMKADWNACLNNKVGFKVNASDTLFEH